MRGVRVSVLLTLNPNLESKGCGTRLGCCGPGAQHAAPLRVRCFD
jgi:hypothetical protein